MKKIAITGASGFIGKNLYDYLNKLGFSLIPFVWKSSLCLSSNQISIKIDSQTNWSNYLMGVDCIVHLASLVHSDNEDYSNFYEINTVGTLRLAQQAINAGVKRFIFISSISVNGTNSGNRIFKSTDIHNPTSSYALSKSLAEKGLINLSTIHRDFELIIIRPVMVYGPGAPGNFSKIIKWASYNLPFFQLPKCNRRNFLSIENLINLISICITHPLAKGRIFLAADPVAYSTYDFIKFTCHSSKKNFFEIPFGLRLIKVFLILTGNKKLLDSLYSSLKIDVSDANKILGWEPTDFIGKLLYKSQK